LNKSKLAQAGLNNTTSPFSANLKEALTAFLAESTSIICATLSLKNSINFELSVNASIINNLSITRCRFNNLTSSGSVEDIRSAIAIINKDSEIFLKEEKEFSLKKEGEESLIEFGGNPEQNLGFIRGISKNSTPITFDFSIKNHLKN
jgi:hypothetical protein